MKFYIASPFFNEEQLETVQRIERLLFSMNAEYFSPRDIGVIKDMSDEEKKASMADIYQSNVDNIAACDGMICVVDWKDTGTLFELGYAACLREREPYQCTNEHLNRAVITYSNGDKPVNVMLRYAIDAHAQGTRSLANIIAYARVNKPIPDQYKNFPEVNE